jgi:ABC-2 type transport system permease protein
METALDLSRWREKPKGVAYRRWTILSHGLRQVLRTRFFRLLLFFAWAAGLVITAVSFVFGQSVATGGWLETMGAQLGVRFQAIASAAGAMVLLYPDICVRGVFTGVFWLQSFVGLGLSLAALTVLVPRLVTRDRASNALTIYLSRPLTSADYLLGKFGIIVGVLVLMWTGPLLAGWALSMLLAPNMDFLVYSFAPLTRALLFNGIALLVLASIALGVSALTRSSRNTILLWIGLWLIAGAIASSPNSPAWLRRASFSHNLSEVRQTVFRLDDVLADASRSLPLLDRSVSRNLERASERTRARDIQGAFLGLGVLVTLSSVVFFRKLRPE